MLRRRTRIAWALITAVALLASVLGSSAWACKSLLAPGHGTVVAMCAPQHGMACCTSACASGQALGAVGKAIEADRSAPSTERSGDRLTLAQASPPAAPLKLYLDCMSFLSEGA